MDINEVSYTVVNENEATTPKYTVLEDRKSFNRISRQIIRCI